MTKSWLTAIPAICALAGILQACGARPGTPMLPLPKTGEHASVVSASSLTVTNEYDIPSPNSLPWDMAAGPDGAVWFAERSAGRLGRITTAGGITEISIAGPARFQFGVASGSDGNLWSTGISLQNQTSQEAGVQSPNNAVFRTTTRSATTAFPLPHDSFPKQIVSGPDGSLWFVERYGKVGRMSTSGQLTEFAIPGGGGPSGITVGPDGALWFTAAIGLLE